VNVRTEKVPREFTFFDRVTDNLVKYMKDKKISNTHVNLAAGSFLGVVGLFIVYKLYRNYKNSRKYRESKDYFKFD
jgi:hypothetical protein